MNAQEQVAALEKAIRDRARTLADEHRQQAERISEQILRDAQERLNRFEQHAEHQAASRAEREYRRLIQAAEIRMQAELDRMRWGLVESVLDSVNKRLQQLHSDPDTYDPLLRRLLSEAAAEIPQQHLIVRVSATDLGMLKDSWESLASAAAPDKVLTLSSDPYPCSGGVLVENQEGRIRMNNTFEGRLERLRPLLQRSIVKHLFPEDSEPEVLFHG
jgi:V/A-type H+-transporting ATPase subunit E